MINIKNIFNYKHKDLSIEKKDIDIDIEHFDDVKEILNELPNIDIQMETETYKKTSEERLNETKGKLMEYIFSKSIKVNPNLSPKLIDSLQLLQNTIQGYIPTYPSYLSQNDDGTYNVSLGAVIDAKKLVKNDNQMNPFDYAEDFIAGTPYEVYELGDGYSVTSFGSIYDGNQRIFSPKRLNEAYVDLVDFENDIVSIRLKYESLLQQGLCVRLPSAVLGIDLNKLRKKLSEFIIDNKFIEFISADPNDPNSVSVEDLVNESGGTPTNPSDIANQLTSKKYLTAEVVTEETEPAKKNYLHLLFLLILGGGSLGVAPLPPSNDKCSKYTKRERGGISILNRRGPPADGQCSQKFYYTYHPKMYSAANPGGSKVSILQIVYRVLSSLGVFNLNVNNSQIYIGFKVSKWKVGCDWHTTNGVSIGGAIETGLCKLQEKISNDISSYFATRTYIRLPVLTDTGHGFAFSKNEELTEGTSSMPRTEQYFTGNYQEEEYFVDVYDKTLPSVRFISLSDDVIVGVQPTLGRLGRKLSSDRTLVKSVKYMPFYATLKKDEKVLQQIRIVYDSKPANKSYTEFLSDPTIYDLKGRQTLEPFAEYYFYYGGCLFSVVKQSDTYTWSNGSRKNRNTFTEKSSFTNDDITYLINNDKNFRNVSSSFRLVGVEHKGYKVRIVKEHSILADLSNIKVYTKERKVKRTPIMATRKLPYYERLQIDLFSRVNFARIYEYIYIEKLYQASVDPDVQLKSILTKVVEIYNSPSYGLKVIASKFPFTYAFAKSYYDGGFHFLYGENLPNDSFVLTFNVGGKQQSVNSIDYIVKQYLNELKICDAKTLKLELFNANNFPRTITYNYK